MEKRSKGTQKYRNEMQNVLKKYFSTSKLIQIPDPNPKYQSKKMSQETFFLACQVS